MEYKRIKQDGAFGRDYINDINEPGKYQIPIPNYDYGDDEEGDEYIWLNVTVTKVVKPPKARYMVIMGYDENGESQAWYYNGSQNCFKRVFQDGAFGGGEYKEKNIEYFFIEDAECVDGEEISNYFRSL